MFGGGRCTEQRFVLQTEPGMEDQSLSLAGDVVQLFWLVRLQLAFCTYAKGRWRAQFLGWKAE